MNDKKYNLYSKFREVHFALPRGWNDSSLGIFISACRLYIEDLQVADEESKWRRIVEYGSQREGNDKLFNVNCVIDLAPAIRSFVELHRERMSDIPAFSDFYKDVEPILGFFPLDHRINRRRSFSSDKPDSKSDLSLEDAVFDVLDEHMESIRSKKANCWMEISREVSERLGIACNVKQFLKGKKERVVVEAQGEDSHEKRKEVFLQTVGRLLNAFDFIEPYAVKKDDFLRAEELPDSEDKPQAKKGRPKKKSFLEEGPSTDLSECVFETFPVSPDEPDNTVEIVVDFATETEKDPDSKLEAIPDEILKGCAQQLGDRLPNSNQAESKPEPTLTSEIPTEPSQSSKDHADATNGSSDKKIPSVPLGSASKRKRGRPPSKIQVTESDDLPRPWGMGEEIVTDTLKKDPEEKVDKSLKTDSKKEKDKKSNKAELDVKPRMSPSKESFELKPNSSGETVHLKPEDTKSLLKTKNAKNEQKTMKRNRSVSKENLTDDSDKLEVKGESKSTRLHDSKKEKKKSGNSPSKAMDEEPEFLRAKGEMTRRQSPRLQSPKRPNEFIIPDDHYTGGSKYLLDPKDIPPDKSPPCTRVLRSEVQYHHNLNLQMADDRLPMKKRSCRTLRSQDRLETDHLELIINIKEASSNENSPISSPVVEMSDAFKLPMKKRGRCSIEITEPEVSDPNRTVSSSSGNSPPVRDDDDCHKVLRSQRSFGNLEAQQPISPPKLRCKDERKLMKAVNDKLSMDKKPVAVHSDSKDQLETKTNLKDSPKKVGTISDIKSKQDKKKSLKKCLQEDQTNDLSEKIAERRSVSLPSTEGEKRRLRSGGLPEEVHQNEDVKFSSSQEKSFETPKDPEKKKKHISSLSKTKDVSKKPHEKSIVTKPIQKSLSEKTSKNKSSTKIKEVKNRPEERKVEIDTESSNKKKHKKAKSEKIRKPVPKIEEPEELPTRLAKTICQLVLAESHWKQPLSKPRSPRKPTKTDEDDKAHENHTDSKSKKKVVSGSKSKDSEVTKKKKENFAKHCEKLPTELKSSLKSHDTKGKIQVQEVQNDNKPAVCKIVVSTEASNVSNNENEYNINSKPKIISKNESCALVKDTSLVFDPEVQHEVVVPHNGNAVDCGSAFPPNFLQQNMDEAMLFNIVNQPDPASGIHVLAETALMSLPEVSGSVLKTDQQPSETENIVQMAQFLKEQMCGGFDSPIGSVPESPKALPLSKEETRPISSEEQMFLTKQFEKEEILLCSEEFQVIPSSETALYVQTLPVTTIKCSDPANQLAQKPCLAPTNSISYQNSIGKPVTQDLPVQTISPASELSKIFENEKITLYQSGPDVEIQDLCVEVCNSPIIEEIVTETPCIQEFVSQDFQKEIVDRMGQDTGYSLINSRTDSELLNIDCIAAEIEIGQTEESKTCVIEESGKTYFTLGVVTKTDGTTALANSLNEYRMEKENNLELTSNYNIGLTSTNFVETVKNFTPLETVTEGIYHQNNLEKDNPLKLASPISVTQSINEVVISTNSVNVEPIKETEIDRPKIKSDIGKESKSIQVPDESKKVKDVSLPISTEKRIVKNASKIPRITKIIRKLEIIKFPEHKEDVIPSKIPELPELSKNSNELKGTKDSSSLEISPTETKVPCTVGKTLPTVENQVPIVEKPDPTVEKTVPIVEKPVQTIEKIVQTVEKTGQTVEKTVSTVEKIVPSVEKTVPTVEKIVPTVESKEQDVEVLPSPGVDISGNSTPSHEPRTGIVCSLPVSLFIPASVLPQPVVEEQPEAKEVLPSERPIKESKELDNVPKNTVDEVPENTVDEVPENTVVEVPENDVDKVPENTVVEVPENAVVEVPENAVVEVPENAVDDVPENIVNVSEQLKDVTPESNVIEKKKEETYKVVNLEVKTTQEKSSNESSVDNGDCSDNDNRSGRSSPLVCEEKFSDCDEDMNIEYHSQESCSSLVHNDSASDNRERSPGSPLQRNREANRKKRLQTTAIRIVMPIAEIHQLQHIHANQDGQLPEPSGEPVEGQMEGGDIETLPELVAPPVEEAERPSEDVRKISEDAVCAIPEEAVPAVPEEAVRIIPEEGAGVMPEEGVDVTPEEEVEVTAEEGVDVISEKAVPVISEEVVCVIPEEAVHVIPEEAVNAIPEEARVIPEEAVLEIPEDAVRVIPEEVRAVREEAAHAIPEEAGRIIPEQAVQVIPEEAIRVIPEEAVADNPEEPVRVVPEEAVRVIPEQFDQGSPRTGEISSTRQSGDSVPHQAGPSFLLQCDEISSTVQAELAHVEAASPESQQRPAAQPTVDPQQQDPPRPDPPRQEAEGDPVPANPVDALPCGININIYPLIAINKVRSKLAGGVASGSRRTRSVLRTGRVDRGDSGSRERGSNASEERKAEPTAKPPTEPISEAHLKKTFFEKGLIRKFIDPDHRKPYVKVINCLKSRIFMNVPRDNITVNRSDSCSVAEVDISIQKALDHNETNEQRDLRPDLDTSEIKKCKESEMSAEVVNENDLPERTNREDDQVVLSPAKKGLTEDSAEKQRKLKKPTILKEPVKVSKGEEILLQKDDKQKILVQIERNKIETEPASPMESVNTDWDTSEDLENNAHGYLRSPPKKVYPSWKERVRERKEDDAVESLINALWESSKSEESEEEFLVTDGKTIEGIIKDSGQIIKKLTHKIGKRKTRCEERQEEDKNKNTDDSMNVKSIGRRKRARIELNDAVKEKRVTRSMKTENVLSKTDKLENKSKKRKYEKLVKIEPASIIEERVKSCVKDVSSIRYRTKVKEPVLKRSRLQGSNSLKKSYSLKSWMNELKELPAGRSNTIKKEKASDFHSKTSEPGTSKEDTSFKYENGPGTSRLNGLSSSHEEVEGKWVPPGSIITPPSRHSAWLDSVLRKNNAQEVEPKAIERKSNAQSSSINSVALLMHNWSCNNQKSGSSAWASSFLQDLNTWDSELIPLLTTTSLMENHKSLEIMESATDSLLKLLGPNSNKT